MKPGILLPLIAMAFCACNQGNRSAEHSDTTRTDTPSIAVNAPASTLCFQRVTGKDSFYLQLTRASDSVAGSLTYNFLEKDDSKGAFRGIMRDSILRGDYEFSSEGIISIRHIVFRIAGDHAYEALPDSFLVTGEPAFPSDDHKLIFDTIPWGRGECR
ncbi:hypothetical protein MKQ68_05685 [Chitinophaga horti]|uniref:Uncharacterized protein n=1 Tax=Chitinophaga horti TaxID=2920382 RepID=A0ABY6J4I0_9BACT|nr:hypothetical protein [Chitinophaga horti]UYQ94581.1 hypothetical protein MKQ68_05685 [Chitinophaga horti]